MLFEPLTLIGSLLAVAGVAASKNQPALDIVQKLVSWLEQRKAKSEEERRRREQQQRDDEQDAVLQDIAGKVGTQDVVMQDIKEKLGSLVDLVRERISPENDESALQVTDNRLPALHHAIEHNPEIEELRRLDASEWRPEDVVRAAEKQRILEDYVSQQLEGFVTTPDEAVHEQINALINRTFTSTALLVKYLRILRAQHGILVLPVIAPALAGTPIRAKLQEIVAHHNASCLAHATRATTNTAHDAKDATTPSRRSAAPIVLADDLVYQPDELHEGDINRLRTVLAWQPTICLQITIRDEHVRFESWSWLRVDDIVSSTEHTVPVVELQSSPLGFSETVAGLAQLYLLLLADAHSVGGYEGVSVLNQVFEQGMIGDRIRVLVKWHTCLREVFGEHYGAAGIEGVPERQPDQAIQNALSNLRWELSSNHRGLLSRDALQREGHYFAALVTTHTYPFSLSLLAIEDKPPEQARVYRRVEPTESTMRDANAEQWMEVLRKAATDFRAAPSLFTYVCTGIMRISESL